MEELLIVGMPSQGLVPILVQVQVAAIRPQALVRQATDWHVVFHELLEPNRKMSRLNNNTSVTVCARTRGLHEPCSFPRLRPKRPMQLQPTHTIPNFEEQTPQNDGSASASGMADKAPSRDVLQWVAPVHLRRSQVTDQHQSNTRAARCRTTLSGTQHSLCDANTAVPRHSSCSLEPRSAARPGLIDHHWAKRTSFDGSVLMHCRAGQAHEQTQQH
mmetsp:Transcript_68752/g.223887  ORF Transcript_68752/g.223887 Transcript_68752/m.223887 type:complete len:216 (-) Transcript_68752:143-790(-)